MFEITFHLLHRKCTFLTSLLITSGTRSGIVVVIVLLLLVPVYLTNRSNRSKSYTSAVVVIVLIYITNSLKWLQIASNG